ncbi:MAG: hypothetical protein J5912_00380, partial [Clostridia bacterium]|nr:hypothetical protein [Clostridia bacterium]
YTFATWNPEISEVTGNVTYTATFTSTVNKYTVTWKNEDGAVLETDENVPYGTVPTYDGDTPTKAATAQYTDTFDKWTPDVAAIEGDTVYTATFTSTVNIYTVTWIIDGESETEEYEYGATPAHADPVKEADAQYTYTFTGWDPEITDVTGNKTYTAQFSSTVNKYTVRFVNGEVELQSEELEYGTMPVYKGEEPTKTADAQYTYAFAGWNPEISEVKGEVTYTAVFDATVNTYTVKWIVEGVETTETYEYGQTPSYKGETPSKPSTTELVYTFTGWDPEIVEVIGPATYTAVFEESARPYTITWKNFDGEIIKTTEVPYGTVPAFDGEVPAKPYDGTHDFVLAGWYPVLVAVTGEATYTAEFAAVTPDVETIDNTLKFNAHTIALYNDLSIIYKVNATLLEGCTDPYIIATINNKAYRIEGVRTSSDGKDRYWFELKNILPQQAATTVYTVLFATKDGETIKSKIDEYSIRNYCKNILNNETYATADTYAKLRTLLVDLVNYGAAAQEYINYRVDDLCNNFLTEEQAAMATPEVPELTDRLSSTDFESPDVVFKGITIRLDAAVSIRYGFDAEYADGLAPVFTNSNGKQSTALVLDNTDPRYSGAYCTYYSGYNFSQMDNPVTLTVYSAEGEAVSKTVTFSINSYLSRHVNDSNAKVANICRALAKLGDSAKAFNG